MTKGPRRLVLDQYLDSAAPGVVKNAGHDWKEKADDLQELGDALRQAAVQAELRIGEQTLTGPALRAGMEQSSTSMLAKAEQLRAAGAALQQVGQQLADTRDVRDSLADLGEKPPPYQAPPGTPGVEATKEEIQAQADASQARSNERSAWQTQYDKQEAKSLALTKEMDAAFLGAIPPMKDIHGQQDPTEPPPSVPSGPGGTYLPGTQAPPPTGGGTGGGDGDGNGNDDDDKDRDKDKDRDDDDPPKPPKPWPPVEPPKPWPPVDPPKPWPPVDPPKPEPNPNPHPTPGPTTTVIGSSQDGISYNPTGGSVPAAGSAGSAPSGGASAAAIGAAGGASGMAAGAIRSGAVPTSATRGATPVRAIGSTGRAGSAGALSRSAGSAGSPASRGAGSAGGRGAASGSTSGRGAAGGRGGAGGRSAGSSAGSRSGGRGSSGARGAAGGGASGKGGRKGEDEKNLDRDSLVYDQDWLGDDDVAPGVLD